VHSRPYHFAADNNDLYLAAPWPAVPGVYDPDGEQTLVCLRLSKPEEREEVIAWLETFDPSALLFLRSVRRVSLISSAAEVAIEHRLISSRPKRLPSRNLPEADESIESIGFRTGTGNRHWTRYTWKVQVPAGLGPRYKTIPPYTPVSVAIPQVPEPGEVFVWLPTLQKGWLPFHMNADFEPTVDRESVQDTAWNRWLVERLGELLTAVVSSRFQKNPRSAWRVVPLLPKQPRGYAAWLEGALESVTASLHDKLAEVEIVVGQKKVAIGQLVYEAPLLEGLVTPEDLEKLEPDRIALGSDVRDKDGVWRKVLAVVTEANQIDVSAGLAILQWSEDDLGSRPPTFFVGMAAAALDAGLGSALSNYACILTSSLLRVKPVASAKELLVREQSGHGLAFKLGLAHAIHPEYLRLTSASTKVREWLERNRHLTVRPTPEKTLSALHAKALTERVELDLEALRLLRDELGEIEGKREQFGLRIGSTVWVDGFVYEGSGRSKQKVRPAEAYQPKAMDKQDHQLSWAQAAGETPGLRWIDSRYADSLAASQHRVGSGPGALFRLLGAQTSPRLEPSPRTLELHGSYAYSTNRTIPTFQREAIANLGVPVDGVTADHVSRDLEAVSRDIAAALVSEARSLRARALVHVVNRHWPGFRPLLLATTVQAYYTLRPTGRVAATWIADLASVKWMSSQAGVASAPSELVIDNGETRLVFGDDAGRFAAEIDESIDDSLLRALGLELSPSSSDLVEQLQKLREETQAGRPIDEELPGRLYRVLAGRVHGHKTRRGGLSQAQLRAKFGIDRDRSGLVFAGGRWHSPNAVFLEPPIFKARRSFVPDRPALRPLWGALGIRSPSLDDCLEVLNEIAAGYPGPDEEAILLDTYRYMEELISRASKRERIELSRLPLLTISGWLTTTPAYAIQQAPDLRAALDSELPTWLHDAPLQLPNLVVARKVTVLTRQEFEPIGLSAEAVLKSDELAELFTLAVGHLREVLAVRDPIHYDRLRTGWKALEAARVWLCPDLRLRTVVGSEPVEISARAHVVERPPVEVFFASDQEAGTAMVGGAVVASLFSDVQSTVGIDFIWQYAWLAAKSGQKPRGIRLAEADDSPEPAPEPLPTAGKRTQRTSGTPGKETKAPHGSIRLPAAPPPPQPRHLKDFSKAQIVGVVSSGQDETAGQVQRRRRKLLQDDPESTVRPPAGTRTYANYTAEQREEAGVAALGAVLASQGRSLVDMRHQHGIGSDVRDDLGKYYELKVHGGEIPDEVAIEDSQLERALREAKNFVLAVVGGVEQGEKTVVKLIENPAERLNLRPSNKLKLFGVTTKKGREYEIVTGPVKPPPI
jgi:hypothetical protein